MLVRNEPFATIITEVFEGYASGRFETLSEIARFLETHPTWPKDKYGKVPQGRVKELLSRPTYAGRLTVGNWGLHMVPGKHEALVSFDTWLAFRQSTTNRR